MAPIMKTFAPTTDIVSKTEQWNCLDHILWLNVFWFIVLHIGAAYGLYLCFTDTKWSTIVFALALYQISLFGATAGVHRLWSHRAYKAILPLRIVLAVCNSIAYQNSIYVWSRDHRVHHKYTESNADPSNATRGMFFAHCGSVMCKKHPDVKRCGGKIDLTDLLADPVVVIQDRYYMPSVVLLCFVMPTLVPWYFWSEGLWNAYFIASVLRYVVVLNMVWCLNSVCHRWGSRDYDIRMTATDNKLLAAVAMGAGFHHFHHVFPMDYRSSEWGWKWNSTTVLLDGLAKLGFAYDMKTVSKEMIEKRKARTGPQCEQYVAEENEFLALRDKF